MVLLITYDLKKPGQNYKPLHDAIKSAGTWWHHLESTWIIETSETPQTWYSRLAPHMDRNDNLLVIEVANNYYGWAPKEAWGWLAGRTFRF